MDASALGSLAGSLARAGLPALGTILGVVVPPPFNLMVGPAFAAISAIMGVDPAAPDAPAQVQAKVDADPAAAADKLQAVEAAHKEAADELKLRLADVQNARATEVEYVKAGSFMQMVPGIWTLMVVGAFISVLAVLLGRAFAYSSEQVQLINILLGVLVGEVARCGSFWLGSSQSSRLRADQAIDFAHKAAPEGAAPRRK